MADRIDKFVALMIDCFGERALTVASKIVSEIAPSDQVVLKSWQDIVARISSALT